MGIPMTMNTCIATPMIMAITITITITTITTKDLLAPKCPA